MDNGKGLGGNHNAPARKKKISVSKKDAESSRLCDMDPGEFAIDTFRLLVEDNDIDEIITDAGGRKECRLSDFITGALKLAFMTGHVQKAFLTQFKFVFTRDGLIRHSRKNEGHPFLDDKERAITVDGQLLSGDPHSFVERSKFNLDTMKQEMSQERYKKWKKDVLESNYLDNSSSEESGSEESGSEESDNGDDIANGAPFLPTKLQSHNPIVRSEIALLREEVANAKAEQLRIAATLKAEQLSIAATLNTEKQVREELGNVVRTMATGVMSTNKRQLQLLVKDVIKNTKLIEDQMEGSGMKIMENFMEVISDTYDLCAKAHDNMRGITSDDEEGARAHLQRPASYKPSIKLDKAHLETVVKLGDKTQITVQEVTSELVSRLDPIAVTIGARKYNANHLLKLVLDANKTGHIDLHKLQEKSGASQENENTPGLGAVPTSEANVPTVEKHITPISNKNIVSTNMNEVRIANTNITFKANHNVEKSNATGQSSRTTISPVGSDSDGPFARIADSHNDNNLEDDEMVYSREEDEYNQGPSHSDMTDFTNDDVGATKRSYKGGDLNDATKRQRRDDGA
jgi:hypothetical protein